MRASIRLSFDDEESFREAVGSLLFNNPPSDLSSPALQQVELESSNGMPLHDRKEDICLSDSPSDLNSLR